MNTTGIVRRIDELGRIVLPIEIRNILDIKTKDPIEIKVEDEKIVLKKYEPSCVFCGNGKNTLLYKGRLICEDCARDLRETYDRK